MPTLRTWLNARRRSMGWVGISVVLFVIVIARIFAFRPFGFIQRPFVAFGTWVNTRTTAVFGACSSKATEFEQLKTQRDSYAIDQASYQALKLENETLKKELGFLQQRKLNAKAASILSRSVSGQTYNFVIDVGSSDHVVEGAAVIVDNGIFIGKVTHVDQRESIVAASTDYRLATGVSLLNQTRTIGIAQGSDGNLIELKFIPADEAVHQNDLVVTSGLEDHVPSGLLVGIVNAVKPEPEAPFQHAIIEPLVDIRQFSHVLVLIPSV